MQLRYKCSLIFIDFDGEDATFDCSLFASSVENADIVCRELLYIKHGIVEIKNSEINLEVPDSAELNSVNKKFFELYSPLRSEVTGLDYQGFLRSFEGFDGYDFLLTKSGASFMIKFCGICCRVVYDNASGESLIDEGEVDFEINGRKYVYLDRLQYTYIGS